MNTNQLPPEFKLTLKNKDFIQLAKELQQATVDELMQGNWGNKFPVMARMKQFLAQKEILAMNVRTEQPVPMPQYLNGRYANPIINDPGIIAQLQDGNEWLFDRKQIRGIKPGQIWHGTPDEKGNRWFYRVIIPGIVERISIRLSEHLKDTTNYKSMILSNTPEGLQREYDALQVKIDACNGDHFLIYGYVRQQEIISKRLAELKEKEKGNQNEGT